MVQRLQAKKIRGLIIGKFMPPHKGHKYLVDFASYHVDELVVLVCSIKSEPIPGRLRHEWMKKEFPQVEVRYVDDENPQEPHEHERFWEIWHDTICKALPEGADYVFASESYGAKLAKVLGMKFVPVDLSRSLVKTSGSEIRKNPLKSWDYILPSAKPYFLKKVCVFGPESTGKSTLTKMLAEHYNTVYANEYARGYLDLKGGKCSYKDIKFIAQGQIASEEALAKQANRVLFTDTDVLTTTIWSDILFGKCPAWVRKEAKKRSYDIYLLLDTNVPFVPDTQRYLPDERQLSLERCVEELEKHGKNYVLISGSWEERFKKAIEQVDRLLCQQ